MRIANDILIPELARLLKEEKEVRFTPSGNSMRPFIEDRRDKIVLTRPGIPKVGDAVLAEIAPGKYVYHRISKIDGKRVELRGDGNIYGTEECEVENIVASTKFIVRKGRRYSPQGKVWSVYSLLWPTWPIARRVWLKLYRMLKLYR